MANDSLRQNITIALQQEGVDAARLVKGALSEVLDEIGQLNRAMAESPAAYREGSAGLAKLESEYRKLLAVLYELNNAKLNPDLAGTQKIDVGLTGLIMSGLKLQATLDKLEATRLDGLASAADRAFDAFQRTVISVDQLAASGINLAKADEVAAQRSGEAMRARIDAYARAERAAEQAARSAIQQAGDEKRARIDALVAAEQAEERLASKRKSVEDQARQILGDSQRQRIEDYARAERQTDKWRESMARLNPEFDAASRGAKNYSYALLNVSHAIQDAQYGFGAVLNNIPLVTQSIVSSNPHLEKLAANFGGPAGVAGMAMIAGVAIDTLVRNFGPAVMQWVRESGLMREATYGVLDGTKKLEDQLAALSSKPFQTRIDTRDIDIATEKLRRYKEEDAAYDRLKTQRSKGQQERGQRATEAIVEYGGGDDFTSSVERIVNALATLTPTTESDATRKTRTRLQHIDEDLADPRMRADPDVIADMMRERASLKEILKDQVDKDMEATRVELRRRVGRVGSGNEADRAWLEQMVRDNSAAFEKQGAGAGLLPGLMLAGRDRIEQDKAGENAVKIAKDSEEQAKKIAQEEKKAADAAARDAKDRIRLAEQAGKDADAEIKRKSDEEAKRFGDRWGDQVQDAMLRRAAVNRQDPKKSMDQLAPDIAGRIEAEGVDRVVAKEAARKIAQQALDAVEAQLAEAGGRTPGAAQQVLGNRQVDREGRRRNDVAQADRLNKQDMVRHLAGQFEDAGGFNPGLAMQMGKQAAGLVEKGADPAAAMQQVMRQVGVQGERQQRMLLRIQANAEAAAGMIGDATRQLAVVEARANQLGRNLRLMQQDRARMRNLNPGLGGRR